jgi:hypothetical protein
VTSLKLVPDSGVVPGLTPALTDIVGQLRDIADHYDKEGKATDADDFQFPKAMVVLKVYQDGEVQLCNIGARLNKFELVGVLECAGRMFTNKAGDADRAGPNAT